METHIKTTKEKVREKGINPFWSISIYHLFFCKKSKKKLFTLNVMLTIQTYGCTIFADHKRSLLNTTLHVHTICIM
jgi:hypothetical protein